MQLKPVSSTKDSGQLLAVTKDGALHLGHYKAGRFIVQPNTRGGLALRLEDIAHVYEVSHG